MTNPPNPDWKAAAGRLLSAIRTGDLDPRPAAVALGLPFDQDVITAILEAAALQPSDRDDASTGVSSSEPGRSVTAVPGILQPSGDHGELVGRLWRALHGDVPGMDLDANELGDLVEEAIAALSRPADEGWRSMATVPPPKDGTHIEVCNNTPSMPYGPTWGFDQRPPAVVHYFTDPDEPGFYLSHGTGELPPFNFTHWRPLPSPPLEGGETS